MSGSGFGRASVFRSDRPRQIDHYIDFFGGEDRLVPGLSEARTAGLIQNSDQGKHVATPAKPWVVGSNRRYTGAGHPVCAATRRRRDQPASGRQL
jgi:hypothetical protein